MSLMPVTRSSRTRNKRKSRRQRREIQFFLLGLFALCRGDLLLICGFKESFLFTGGVATWIMIARLRDWVYLAGRAVIGGQIVLNS